MKAQTHTQTIPAEFRFLGEPVSLTKAEAGNADASGASASAKTADSRLSMVANSGRPFDGWGFPAIFDMAGAILPANAEMPYLRQHDGGMVIGRTDKIECDANGIRCEGPFYADVAAARDMVAAKGHKWQSSIGAQPVEAGLEWVGRSEQKTVNGHVFSDGLIIRRWKLKEASVVALGADGETSATVIAAAAGVPQINLPPRPGHAPALTPLTNLNASRSNKHMSEPTPAPAPAKATLADLKAQFPKDREFALDQFEAGATMSEAKAAYADVLQGKLDAAEKAAASAATAPAPAPTKSAAPRVAVPIGGRSAAAKPEAFGKADAASDEGSEDSDSAVSEWNAKLNAEISAGLSKSAAVSKISRAHPDLHEQYLAEVNGGMTIREAGLRKPVQIASKARARR